MSDYRCLSYYVFRGTKFVQLPYVVKGMDVSFSGLLSFIEVNTNLLNHVLNTYKLIDSQEKSQTMDR